MADSGVGAELAWGSTSTCPPRGTGSCRYSQRAEPAPVTVMVTPTAAMSAATSLALFIDEHFRSGGMGGRGAGESHFHLLPGNPALTMTGGHAVEADLAQY